ncbi:hypothetical protein [Streptomyces sp. NBRC 109706]|nr:hypothetical protein [Streptomyces sp. NBRC 109706]
MAEGTTEARRDAPSRLSHAFRVPVPLAVPAPRLLTCRRHIDLLRVCSAG